jgi:hypothetical protein
MNAVPDNQEWRGLTTLQDNGDSLVELAADGMNEQTVLHELLHAYVQQVWGGIGLYTGAQQGAAEGRARSRRRAAAQLPRAVGSHGRRAEAQVP